MRHACFAGIFFCVLLSMTNTAAQTLSTPVEYMDYLTSREQELSKKYLGYMSEVAHGNRARKMEKRRQELIVQIRQSLSDANKLKPYKGDVTLRDSFRHYWDILLKVFTEDYSKIVNMEEIAEQSYDNMEAYLLAQEKAGDVLDEASGKLAPAYKTFAENNNVRLIDGGDSKMQQKLRQVSLVNDYYHQLFLIFFKSFKQEAYVWDAFNKKDINGLEQNKNSLVKVSEEGLAKLDTIKPFNGDNSLVVAVRNVLAFHKAEAEKQLPGLTDYLIKNEDFTKIKKAFDSKPEAKRTQADVDLYNKAVVDFNASVNSSNKVVNESNAGRQRVMDNWENSRKNFMDKHIPKGK
jgi:hypothetical protein